VDKWINVDNVSRDNTGQRRISTWNMVQRGLCAVFGDDVALSSRRGLPPVSSCKRRKLFSLRFGFVAGSGARLVDRYIAVDLVVATPSPGQPSSSARR